MKQKLIVVLLCVLAPMCGMAQDAEGETQVKDNEFLKELASVKRGEGVVRIYQDGRLPQAISEKSYSVGEQQTTNYILISGYRVQVFSSNTPKVSRSEAYNMEVAIREEMPDVPVYVTFMSPFWKVRVGDCRNYQEATTLLSVLKKKFSDKKNDFYIVKEDNIQVPIK